MNKIRKCKYVFIAILISCIVPCTTFGEQCVEGARKLVQWASDWHGDPYEWTDKGESYGLDVDQTASGCTSSDPCILVYPRNYGSEISKKYGHVAVLKSSSSPYSLQDSNGVCGGGDRVSCKKDVRLNDAYVIHPPLTLTSGKSISKSVDKDKWKQYKIKASSSNSKVEIELAPVNGDPDLYVRNGNMPTTSLKDCCPYKGGTRSEFCIPNNSGENWYFIGVKGYKASNFKIKATLSNNSGNDNYNLSKGHSSHDSVNINLWKYYKYTGGNAEIEITNLSNDVDLYVQKNTKPTKYTFECRPYEGGTQSELCRISSNATWYIGVFGYRSGSYKIKVK